MLRVGTYDKLIVYGGMQNLKLKINRGMSSYVLMFYIYYNNRKQRLSFLYNYAFKLVVGTISITRISTNVLELYDYIGHAFISDTSARLSLGHCCIAMSYDELLVYSVLGISSSLMT